MSGHHRVIRSGNQINTLDPKGLLLYWIPIRTSAYKLSSVEDLFAHNLILICQIVSKCYTEHDSVTVVLCTKFQIDLTNDMNVIEERNFANFELKMSLGVTSRIATTSYILKYGRSWHKGFSNAFPSNKMFSGNR